nr:alpha-N-acetylglucosaminidase C-terminal domain-containing protein [Muribaculum intestinale]
MNHVIDEYVFAKVWEPGLGYRQWADRWAGSRGAKVSDAIARAWRILADSVYVKCTRVGEACQTNSRPFVDKPTGGYTNSSYRYSQNALVEALRLMLSDERAWSNAALSRDAVNIGVSCSAIILLQCATVLCRLTVAWIYLRQGDMPPIWRM